MVTIYSERFLSELWDSCTLDVHILLESWAGLLLLLMSWIFHKILVLLRFSVGWIRLFLMHVLFQIYYPLQLIRHRDQSHLHHLDSDLMHDWWFSDHHHSLIEILRVGGLHSIGSSFSHRGKNDENIMPFENKSTLEDGVLHSFGPGCLDFSLF